jgi:heme exporter protein D
VIDYLTVFTLLLLLVVLSLPTLKQLAAILRADAREPGRAATAKNAESQIGYVSSSSQLIPARHEGSPGAENHRWVSLPVVVSQSRQHQADRYAIIQAVSSGSS